jgi:hypothetical protein
MGARDFILSMLQSFPRHPSRVADDKNRSSPILCLAKQVLRSRRSSSKQFLGMFFFFFFFFFEISIDKSSNMLNFVGHDHLSE